MHIVKVIHDELDSMVVNGTINMSLDTMEYNDYYENFGYPEPYLTIRNCLHWAAIVIVLMSVFGNSMIITIMTRKQNKDSSTSTFFIVLAISDMSIALLITLERWLLWICNVTLYDIHSSLTTSKVILTYSNVHISSWSLVCITVERVISIATPFKVKDICTKTRARVTICIVCGVILLLNTIEFTQIVNVKFFEGYGLLFKDKVENGSEIVDGIDFALSFFIPITVIIIGSVYILVTLSRIDISKQSTRNNRNRSLTMTLLGANIAFVLTMSPFVIFSIIGTWLDGLNVHDPINWTLYEVFLFLSDMNAALNFFVYVLSGSKFRSDLLQLFGFKAAK